MHQRDFLYNSDDFFQDLFNFYAEAEMLIIILV